MAQGDSRVEVLELRVHELKQLFDSMDPSPFRERDLDPHAEEFIVGWARELHTGTTPALTVRVEAGASPEEAALLQEAVSEFFRNRAQVKRRELHRLLRYGRISLLIGLAFITVALVVSDLLSGLRYGIVRESVVIGAWVALWRPLEIFLYDWWPIRAEARLNDRLAAARVEIAP
ncbi:MAG TPA: hypothetical protein VNF72_20155 [Myxococcota bacterium]|nr:hypothetical protein [Myxococcota bacterium]